MIQFVLPPEPPAMVVLEADPRKEQGLPSVMNIASTDIPITVNDLHPSITPAGQSVLILVQDRTGQKQEFEITPPGGEETAPGVQVLDVKADRQEYDQQRQVVTATGNVEVRFARGVLTADRIQVNLENQLVVAEGEVALRRGEQVLRGERFEYSIAQDSGTIDQARGEIYQPTIGRDFSPDVFTDADSSILPERPLSDRALANQPLQRITSPGRFSLGLGSRREIQNVPLPEAGGTINRLRFEAEQINFIGEDWRATNIRITNDPFSPPELELRADTARYLRRGEVQTELITTDSRLVFDQGFSVPIFQDRIVLDGRDRDPRTFGVGYDDDRGGLFTEWKFPFLINERVEASIAPQYFVQRSLLDSEWITPDAFGVEAKLEVDVSPRTTVRSTVDLTSLDPSKLDDELRFNFQGRRVIGNRVNPYVLNLEYSYRDRFFNGSLGEQTVQSSLGAVLTSPVYTLDESGVNFSYQLGVQDIVAETDREEFLDENQDDDLLNLTRYQMVASLGRGFLLWQGEALPATETEGLRYSPIPVQPFLRLNTNLTGVNSIYENEEGQRSLGGSISLEGQIGQFSDAVLDYTAFNIGLTQIVLNGESPFQFDRIIDTSVLSLGLMQQVYGPFRVGFQTAINIEDNEAISTDYFLEYSRRTYRVVLRYNPKVQLGSLNFQVFDFNWFGSPDPFDEPVTPVEQGVSQ
jgi:hypothetical protein